MSRLRVATRGSPLALWQAEHIATLLRTAHAGTALEVELTVVETMGDRRQDRPIHELGGQGAFAKEVQAAVLDGRADLAVHSAKDLPSQTPAGLRLACVPRRGDRRDALVGSTLDALAPGATVATGSVRRQAQLAHRRPDLRFVDLRGNIGTRLGKVPDGGAIVMAAVALERLGLQEHVAEVLEPGLMVPQVAQGALAVECRADDTTSAALLAAIEHEPSRREVDAERAFLARLGGGCDLPVGATAYAHGAGVRVTGVLASDDRSHLVRATVDGADPVEAGRRLADELVAALGASTGRG